MAIVLIIVYWETASIQNAYQSYFISQSVLLFMIVLLIPIQRKFPPQFSRYSVQIWLILNTASILVPSTYASAAYSSNKYITT
jgi:hypothetical protein